MTKIEVRELKKAYIERRTKKRFYSQCGAHEYCPVLDGISFSIPTGCFTCFIGPSGCGKSTMFRIISGFEEPTSGSVLIDGKEVEGPSSRHVCVFQEDGLFPWFTARENIGLGLKDARSPGAQEEIEEYLELVGLSGFGDHYPHELSGGMRRRAEVARALIMNPDILFMDEPFGALDFVTRLQMREEMVNVHQMFDMTILFITHDIDEALQLGDKIIMLTDRPSKVAWDLDLDFPHPRDLSVGPLRELRREIYHRMGLHVAL
ncbi:MAG: ABC transporter ATP-binding protein [Thermodesulfobacteria bacterium]|nr:ABC transporter ATP-binding protein [Thermodesulfobacteriota bacterium]